MPVLRKLTPAEIAAQEQRRLGARAQVMREYDTYVADFAIGDYGRVDLDDSDRRAAVRSRLHAAARRRGLTFRFRPGRGAALIFHVEAAPAVERPAAMPTAGTPPRRDTAPRREPESARPPRRRQSSTERYSDVLPRWMRDDQRSGQRSGGKRRTR